MANFQEKIYRALSGAFILITLALGFRPPAHAQNTGPTVLWVNCGGEDDAPCIQGAASQGWNLLPPNTPADNTTNQGDAIRCDLGLLIHQNSDGSLTCKNRNRLTVGESDPNFNPPWLSFARQNQFDSIQADTPLPFAPVLGTHNSYSNYFDGGASSLSVDQGFDITDQLQYGARTIRLDPWLFTNTDNQIRLCHSSNGLPVNSLSLCVSVDQTGVPYSYNRPFVFAIKEIAHWLKQHPSEAIVLRLHDNNQGWCCDNFTGLVEDSTGSVNQVSINKTNYFCWTVAMGLGSMVYKNPINDTGSDGPSNECSGTADVLAAVPDNYRFPTPRQLRAMDKQVIVVSQFSNEWAFEDANGTQGPGISSIGLASTQISPKDLGTNCANGYAVSGPTPVSYTETGEDRSVSQLLANLGISSLILNKAGNFLDTPTVVNALSCGFTWMEADFLGTLNEAPNQQDFTLVDAQCDDYTASSCSTTDHRREAMIWSWNNAPATGAANEPAQISIGLGSPLGSWFSVSPSSQAPYLCASWTGVSGFLNGVYPDNFNWWYVTRTEGPWNGGETACQNERGLDWHFWRPGSAVQNIVAWNNLRASGAGAAWVNHFNGPIQALPMQLTFNMQQGVVPTVSQTVVVSGGYGGALTAMSSDHSVQAAVVPLYNPLNSTETAKGYNNSSNLYTVSLGSAAAQLGPGQHQFSLTFSENYTLSVVDPGNASMTPISSRSNVNVTVNVIPPTVPVTINTSPSGYNIFVDGSAYTTPQTFNWGPGSSHTLDASQPIVNSQVRATFQNWSDSGAVSHTVVVPPQPTSYTATFNVMYYLSLAETGSGQVNLNPTVTGNFYPAGAPVQISATPNAGSYFIGFSGDLTGTASPQTLTMNAPHIVSAAFGNYAVVQIPPNIYNAPVIADGVSHPTPAIFQWIPSSSHTLSFAPIPLTSGKQAILQSWTDGNTTNPRTISAATGTYTPVLGVQWYVNTAVNPAGAGQITAPGWYNDGSSLQFTETANGGYAFAGFTGDVQASSSPQTVTVSKALSVTANFTPASPRLNVTGSVINDSGASVPLTLVLNNTGAGAAAGVNVAIAVSVLTGSGTVTLPSSIPTIPSIQGNNSAALPLTFGWPTTANRIRLTVTFTANGGAYQGSQVLNLFR